MDEKTLLRLAKTHGTPLVVVDHKVLRENYAQFRKYLPRVQVYYAVKANSAPEIVRTFYEAGASFDVASVAEFLTVHENVKDLPEDQRDRRSSGIASSTPIPSRPPKRSSSWIPTSPSSPTTTMRKSSRSPGTRRTPVSCCG